MLSAAASIFLAVITTVVLATLIVLALEPTKEIVDSDTGMSCEDLAINETLRTWASTKSIDITKTLLPTLANNPKLQPSDENILKPNFNWLLDIKPSQIQTKLRKPPTHNLIIFSDPFAYMKHNYTVKDKTGVPIERYHFAEKALWPIYKKDKKINLLYCVTAPF